MSRWAALAALSLVFLPAARAADDPPATETVRHVLASKVLGEERSFRVLLPSAYDELPESSYPVLYLTDGDTQLDHVAASLRFLVRQGMALPMIVVALSHPDRTRDLTPSRASLRMEDGSAMDFPSSGGADAFLEHLEREVIPFVEDHYRTKPLRVLAGHSFGGLFALHALAKRPELFGAVFAASPTLVWDEGVVLKELKSSFGGRTRLKCLVFAALGDEPDLRDSFDALERIFKKSAPRGTIWQSRLFPDEDHGSVVLPAYYYALRVLFDGLRAPEDTYRAGLGALEAHYRKLSLRLGYEVPVPEWSLNRLGYRYLMAGDLDRAAETLKLNTERHPESANVWDSLGEVRERQGRLAEARALYEKAFTIAASRNAPMTALYKRNWERMVEALADGKSSEEPPSEKEGSGPRSGRDSNRSSERRCSERVGGAGASVAVATDSEGSGSIRRA